MDRMLPSRCNLLNDVHVSAEIHYKSMAMIEDMGTGDWPAFGDLNEKILMSTIKVNY